MASPPAAAAFRRRQWPSPGKRLARWSLSTVLQADGLADFRHCRTCAFARALAAFRNDAAQQFRVLLVLAGALANRRQLREDSLGDRLLAVEAADACRTAAFLHPVFRGLVRIDLVQVPDRALVRVARVRAADAGRV